MVDKAFYARGAQTRLEEALADTPVVRVHGPRQCGKTTLASASRQGLCCTMAKAPWDLGTAFLPFQFVHCGRRHEGATKKRKYDAQFKVIFDTIR
jgi:hypothetical protein